MSFLTSNLSNQKVINNSLEIMQIITFIILYHRHMHIHIQIMKVNYAPAATLADIWHLVLGIWCLISVNSHVVDKSGHCATMAPTKYHKRHHTSSATNVRTSGAQPQISTRIDSSWLQKIYVYVYVYRYMHIYAYISIC